ncbi:hypothetical protein [Lactobacillus corticis]|uniref:hypothetical protein n=1 Tax=Lactobacillus corticis TaxID=2201249 RepID=UPI001BB2D6CC|nr:hypothetical protein [Lactobacillus corticis]
MNRRRIRRAKLLLLSTLVILIWLMYLARTFPANVQLGLAGTLTLAVIMPLVLPNLIGVWLNLIMIIIGTGLLLFGYIIMPTSQKMILIFAGPLTTLLLTGLVNYLFHWSSFSPRSRAVQRYVRHFVPLVKMAGIEDAEKLYADELRSMKEHPKMPLVMNLRLVHVEAEQFKQFHQQEYNEMLIAMSDLLKNHRLPSERLFYTGDASFLVVSYSIDPQVYAIINSEIGKRLKQILQPYGMEASVVMQKITYADIEKFPDFKTAFHHLKRLLETEIRVEYLEKN